LAHAKTNFQQTTINPSKTQNLNYVKSNKKTDVKNFSDRKKNSVYKKKEKRCPKIKNHQSEKKFFEIRVNFLEFFLDYSINEQQKLQFCCPLTYVLLANVNLERRGYVHILTTHCTKNYLLYII